MKTIEGKGNIKATIIADSVSRDGVRIVTYELEYPRFIHSEFMTHRLFSRNAASSRAIPVTKMLELVKTKTAMPIHWGKNQPGMSAKEECNERVWMGRLGDQPDRCETREGAWQAARDKVMFYAREFHQAGYHKQIVNRLLEPFTFIKVVCTATEYDNFFWLRNHPDAQPEIQELARVMWELYGSHQPTVLNEGSWHVPYYNIESSNVYGCWIPSMDSQMVTDVAGVTLQDALSISSSCCAQVSYRVLDDSIEKARDIYQRLVEAKPVHASPFEHQATPMGDNITMMDDGVTHRTRQHSPVNLWSGNLRGWIQHRQLIPGNTCWKFREDR